MTSSPSPPDIGSLSLSPQRTQPPHDLYDYDNSNGRSPYHYQTSPPVIPGQPLYANANSFSMAQTPIKAAKPSRAALPSVRPSRVQITIVTDLESSQQWLENSPSQLNDSRSMSPPSNSEISSGGGSPPRLGNLQNQTPYTPAGTGPEDEIIPTAIVIKNIPFNVKRETLLDIIVLSGSFCRRSELMLLFRRLSISQPLMLSIIILILRGRFEASRLQTSACRLMPMQWSLL